MSAKLFKNLGVGLLMAAFASPLHAQYGGLIFGPQSQGNPSGSGARPHPMMASGLPTNSVSSQSSAPSWWMKPRAESPTAMPLVQDGDKNFGQKVTGAMRGALTAVQPKPKVVPAYDPTMLGSEPGPLGPDLYLASARLAEQSGDLEGAQRQYEQVLAQFPRHRKAMISFARMKHRQGDLDGAIQVYQNSLSVHRDDPVAMNDLALCLARKGHLEPAAGILRRVTQLQPGNTRYVNNLATVLVEANRVDEAVASLTSTHGPATANYNVGYLLQQKGQTDAAVRYLQNAANIDPTLASARDLLAELQSGRAAATVASRPIGTAVAPTNEGPIIRQSGTLDSDEPARASTAEFEQVLPTNSSSTSIPPSNSTISTTLVLPTVHSVRSDLQPGSPNRGDAPLPQELVVPQQSPFAVPSQSAEVLSSASQGQLRWDYTRRFVPTIQAVNLSDAW